MTAEEFIRKTEHEDNLFWNEIESIIEREVRNRVDKEVRDKIHSLNEEKTIKRWSILEISEDEIEMIRKFQNRNSGKIIKRAGGATMDPDNSMIRKCIEIFSVSYNTLAEGSIDEDVLKVALFGIQKKECNLCGERFPISIMQIDHIYPKSKKEDNSFKNKQLLCSACNGWKSGREMKLIQEALLSIAGRYHRPRYFSNDDKNVLFLDACIK